MGEPCAVYADEVAFMVWTWVSTRDSDRGADRAAFPREGKLSKTAVQHGKAEPRKVSIHKR